VATLIVIAISKSKLKQSSEQFMQVR
jgi:hypothetical protein